MVDGAPTVNPAGEGTKGALHYVLDVPAGGRRQIRLRLTRTADAGRGAAADRPTSATDFDAVLAPRQAEADEFFAELIPAAATADEALVARQAHRRADVGQAVLPLRRASAG